jgi:histidinol-phosphate aminotransferase
MYRFYSEIFDIVCVPTDKNRLRPDVDAMIKEAGKKNASVIIFSNPCNPSGLGVSRKEVLRLCRSVSGLVVVDEAYMDFWDQSIIADLNGLDNAIVLKTMSKAAGLAAARLGFALGSKSLTDGIRKVKSPFNVNMLTQAAGRVLLGEKEYLEDCRKAIIDSRISLEAKTRKLSAKYPESIKVLPTVTNFVLVECADPDGIYAKLIEKSVCVRKSFGSCLRVSAGSEEENELFISARESILREEA